MHDVDAVRQKMGKQTGCGNLFVQNSKKVITDPRPDHRLGNG